MPRFSLSAEQIEFIRTKWETMTNRAIAEAIGESENTVSKYGRRYLELGCKMPKERQPNIISKSDIELPILLRQQIKQSKKYQEQLQQIKDAIQIGQHINLATRTAEVIFKGINFATLQFYKNGEKTYPECFFYSQLKKVVHI